MNGVILKTVSQEGIETYHLTFQCGLINKAGFSKGEVLEILLKKMQYAIDHNQDCIEWID